MKKIRNWNRKTQNWRSSCRKLIPKISAQKIQRNYPSHKKRAHEYKNPRTEKRKHTFSHGQKRAHTFPHKKQAHTCPRYKKAHTYLHRKNGVRIPTQKNQYAHTWNNVHIHPCRKTQAHTYILTNKFEKKAEKSVHKKNQHKTYRVKRSTKCTEYRKTSTKNTVQKKQAQTFT